MNKKSTSIVYMLLSFITLIAGYLYLRVAYNVTGETAPFTQEIIITILGTLATIFITALLLNKQTAVEVEKEQRIRYIELKTTTYQQLLDLLEQMSILDKFTNKEIIKLQFITHKLAIIASAEVIDEYQSFLELIKKISNDNSFSGDMTELHDALGSLTMQIRKDILGSNNSHNYTDKKINAMIKDNSHI